MTTYISQYPPAQNNTYVRSTTWWGYPFAGDEPRYYPWYATDPTKSLTGDHLDNSWVSQQDSTTNQRFHIDLGSAKIIQRIYYENGHHYGSYTDRGAKTFTVWGSNNATAFATLTYATDTNWTQITASQSTFDRHVSADRSDAKYITLTNTTAYRYYAVKIANNWGGAYYMSLRRIVLQIAMNPDAPTNVAATDGTHTDKVVVTWSKSAGATGYKVYRDSVEIATVGDVATYDDTGAGAPIITPGMCSASDGTSNAHVALSISGHSVANGSSSSYTVVATNAYGDSAASTADTGYRGAGTLTYQWQMSAADSDATYTDISGATTASYNATGAPAQTITPGAASASNGSSAAHVSLSISGHAANNGAGRYFRCVLNATGSAEATAASDRGYRASGSLSYQWQRSAADSNTDFTDISGGTTASYNDTAAPDDGSGRYFRCALSADGADTAYSSADRGYRYIDSVAPTVTTTDPATNIDCTTADVSGNITATGGANCSVRGICYNTTGSPDTSDQKVYDAGSFGPGAFTKTLIGLIEETLYYCKAFATNSAGTAYGDEVELTTAANALTVTTSSVSSITETTAKVYGAITATGSAKATVRGVCYGISANPTTSDSLVQRVGTFGLATFVERLTGLTPNTTYHVRAFATNVDGTDYGADVSFITDAITVPITTPWNKVPTTSSTWLSETGKTATWIPEQNGHTGRMIYVDNEVIYIDSEKYIVDGSDIYEAESYS